MCGRRLKQNTPSLSHYTKKLHEREVFPPLALGNKVLGLIWTLHLSGGWEWEKDSLLLSSLLKHSPLSNAHP